MSALASILLPLLLLQPTDAVERLDQSVELLERADSMLVSVNYDDEELRDVMEDLKRRISIPLRADWDALTRLVIADFDRVSLTLHSVSALTTLEALAVQLGDEFERPVIEAHAGYLVLTTAAATASMREMDVYDVRDLLAEHEIIEELRATAPPIIEPASEPEDEPGDDDSRDPASTQPADEDENESDDDPDAEDDDDAPPRPEGFPTKLDLEKLREVAEAAPAQPLTPGRELMLLLIEHISPDAWTLSGGARAEISERNGVLLVSAPPSVHRALRQALERLRTVNPSSVTIEASVVQLPRAQFDRLVRRHDLLTSDLAHAVLASDATIILWRGGSAVAVDHELSINTAAAETSFQISVAPTLIEDRGAMRLDIDCSMRRGSDARSVTTTVDAPLRNSAATIEFPGVETSETVTLLIVTHRRV